MGRAFLASVFRSTSFVDCFSTMADLDNLSADMDAANLYTEEIVTDRKMGTIHVLTPITPEGAKDPTRAPIFTGEVQIMTQMGPLPISFDIPAVTSLPPASPKLFLSTAKPLRKACVRRSNVCKKCVVKPQARSSPPALPVSGYRLLPARSRCLNSANNSLNPNSVVSLRDGRVFCSKVWIRRFGCTEKQAQKSRCILIRHNGLTTSPPEIPLRQKDSATN